MFDRTYEQRLKDWTEFRTVLDHTVEDPLILAIQKYKWAPTVSIHTDPWTRETWPSPWELIEENTYCEFCKLLGICYTLQLTDKFSQAKFEIHIGIDDSKSASYYLLFIDQFIIGYLDDSYIHANDLPPSFRSQQVYSMHTLN
jgi:hypothetical protein